MTYVPPVIPPSGKVPNVSTGMVADLNTAYNSMRTMSAALVDHDRTHRRVFQPEAYGAIGDGVANDTAALQACFDAARVVSGCVILRYGAIHNVAGTLDPTGTEIDGYGATLKILSGVTPTWNVLQGTGAFVGRGFTIDLNKANTTDPGSTSQGLGVYVYNATGWTGSVILRDVTVKNGHQAGIKLATPIAITDALNAPPSASLLENVTIDGTKWGVFFYATNGGEARGCTVRNTVSDGIHDYLSRDTQVLGGQVSDTGGHGVVTAYSHGFSCQGVNVTHAEGMGIVAGGGSTTITETRNFTITGNRVRGCVSNNISVDPTKTGSPTTVIPVYSTISGNVSDGSGVHGIYLHNARYVAVTGNTCRANVNGGLSMDARDVAVAGNVFTGNGYGIRFLGNSGLEYGRHAMSRNVVFSNTSNFFFDTVGATGVALDLYGMGTPEAIVAAPIGSQFSRTDGGAGTCLYVKESGGSGSTGWVAK